MSLNLTQILAVITGAMVIASMCFIYVRSRGGEPRAIRLSNQVLLPVLSIIVVVLNIVFANRQTTPTCTGVLGALFYAGVIGVILLITVGCLCYFLSRRRDRRFIIHPVLFSVILVTIIVLIEYLNGCL